MSELGDGLQLEVHLSGVETSVEMVSSLENWLRREEIRGLTTTVAAKPASPGEMGLDPVILSVILGSQAVLALVQSIHVWIKASRPEATVTISNGTREVRVSARNVPNTETLLRDLLADTTLRDQPY